MPTVSEPVDYEQRNGKALGLAQRYINDEIGEDTFRVSLSILRFDSEEVRRLVWAADIEKLKRWAR